MKRVVPYPLLLILATLLDRIAISSTQINVAQSLRPIIFLMVLAGITLLAVQRFVKDWHYANYIVLMLPVELLVYRA